jgi:hypothetical protein
MGIHVGFGEAPGMQGELNEHLETLREQGQVHSQGVFSVAREQALEKLAAFQLPFPGAWAVKVVQAVVASGATEPILFYLRSREVDIRFVPGRPWSLEEIVSRLDDPGSSPDRALNHLAAALWAVGRGGGHEFELSFPVARVRLRWSKGEFHRLDWSYISRPEGCPPTDWATRGLGRVPWIDFGTAYWSLRVAHLSSKTALPRSKFGQLSQVANSNADVSRALTSRCFSCPLPLSLDSRRLEGLQLCPRHGYTTKSYPIALGLEDGPYPPLGLAARTFEPISPEDARRNRVLGMQTGGVAPQLEPRPETALAFLVASHSSGLISEELQVPSTCSWVADGAVLEVEPYDVRGGRCAVGVFLDATGYSTDLSGLKLGENALRQQHKAAAAQTVLQRLEVLSEIDLESREPSGAWRVGFVGLGLFGLCTVLASPLAGAPILAFTGLMAHMERSDLKTSRPVCRVS